MILVRSASRAVNCENSSDVRVVGSSSDPSGESDSVTPASPADLDRHTELSKGD